MVPVSVDNNTQETLTLNVTGAGLAKPFTAAIKTGHTELEMPFVVGNPGTLSFQLKNAKGKLLDQRDLPRCAPGFQTSAGAHPVVARPSPVPGWQWDYAP